MIGQIAHFMAKAATKATWEPHDFDEKKSEDDDEDVPSPPRGAAKVQGLCGQAVALMKEALAATRNKASSSRKRKRRDTNPQGGRAARAPKTPRRHMHTSPSGGPGMRSTMASAAPRGRSPPQSTPAVPEQQQSAPDEIISIASMDSRDLLNAVKEWVQDMRKKRADLLPVEKHTTKQEWKKLVPWHFEMLQDACAHSDARGFSLFPLAEVRAHFFVVDATVLHGVLKSVDGVKAKLEARGGSDSAAFIKNKADWFRRIFDLPRLRSKAVESVKGKPPTVSFIRGATKSHGTAADQ